jgi:hypothetical protein
MDEIRVSAVMDKDGELSVNAKGLPFKKGEQVEITIKGMAADDYPNSTAERLLKSKLVGLWKHRTDIGDSVEFARELRQKAGRRDW